MSLAIGRGEAEVLRAVVQFLKRVTAPIPVALKYCENIRTERNQRAIVW